MLPSIIAKLTTEKVLGKALTFPIVSGIHYGTILYLVVGR